MARGYSYLDSLPLLEHLRVSQMRAQFQNAARRKSTARACTVTKLTGTSYKAPGYKLGRASIMAMSEVFQKRQTV